MTSPFVILLNGPPNSGKDAIGAAMLASYPGITLQSFKSPFYGLLAEFYMLPLDQVLEMCADRDRKEIPCDEFEGRSPRQAMIHVSEQVVKPNYGIDWFGRRAAASLKPGINLFTDSGFYAEAYPIINLIGLRNVMLVHILRNGTSFVGDSRDWLPPDGFDEFCRLDNNGDLKSTITNLASEISLRMPQKSGLAKKRA